MAKTVEQLLKKKKFTGQEVGQAYLLNLAAQKKAQKEGKDTEPPFTRADLDRMEASIQTREQHLVFSAYVSIYRSVVDAANMAQANLQQFYHAYYRLFYTLMECMRADQALEAMTEQPLIMTQGQLDRIIKELTEERRSFTASFYELVAKYIEWAIYNPEQAPRHIREIIEATKKEACTNERILTAYREDYGSGYYELPDGTRSDRVTPEEWQQLLIDRFLESQPRTENGEEVPLEVLLKAHRLDRIKKLYCLYYIPDTDLEPVLKGLKNSEVSVEKIKKEIREQYAAAGRLPLNLSKEEEIKLYIKEAEDGLKWHHTEPEEALSKYDVLTEFDLFLRYRGGIENDVEEKQQFEELAADYPALFNAAVKEIKKPLPKAAKLKKEDFLKPVFTYGEVSDSGLTMFDGLLNDFSDFAIIDYFCNEDTTENMQKRQRILYSGLAIVRENSGTKNHIAENGDYIELNTRPYSYLNSIDSITDNEEEVEKIQTFKTEFIEPSFKFIYAFNELIDIIATVYEVESLKEFKLSTEYIEDKTEAYNELIYATFISLYGTGEEIERKQMLFKQVFSPIEAEQLKPAAAAVQKVKEKIKAHLDTYEAIRLLNDFYPLIGEIMGEGA